MADFDDIKKFTKCCQFPDKDKVNYDKGDPLYNCKDTLEDAAVCIDDCLHPCVTETAWEYASCVAGAESGLSCLDKEECLDSLKHAFYEVDYDKESSRDKSNDWADSEVFNDFVEEMEDVKENDCDDTKELADDVCVEGEACCADCQEELGDVLSCFVDNVLGPIIAQDFNLTDSSEAKDFKKELKGCPQECPKVKKIMVRDRRRTQQQQRNLGRRLGRKRVRVIKGMSDTFGKLLD